jgi:hypothetical protein
MIVNRIKICPHFHELQLWFSRLRQCLFWKLLRQWTHKMGRILSTLKHLHPIFIWYHSTANSHHILHGLRFEFVYQSDKDGCSCFNWYLQNYFAYWYAYIGGGSRASYNNNFITLASFLSFLLYGVFRESALH